MTYETTETTTETKPPAIYAAIAAVSAALARDGISKDRRNQQQGYTFRGIDDIYKALSPLLAQHHIVILPHVEERVETVREAKSGGSIYSVALRVCYSFCCATDGSTVDAVVWGEAMDSGDKATNKALSASYKYMALMTFCIPVNGQDDADAVTPPASSPAVKQAAKPADAKPAAKAVDAFGLAEEAIAAIEQATTAAALQDIGKRIASSDLTGLDAENVRKAWLERRTELRGAPA